MDRTTHRHRHERNEYDLNEDLEKIRAALSDTSYDLKGKANDLFDRSKESIKKTSAELENNIGNYIAEKPFKSLGIALLSGIVLGLLLRK